MVALCRSSLAALILPLCACATRERLAFEPEADASTTESSPTTPSGPTGHFSEQDPPTDTPGEVEIHEVYGHSAKTLYKLDPKTKAVTAVGDFKNCETINDIALDEASTMYGASYKVLYIIDRKTATCTPIKTGDSYPNSLSFVPKGTVDEDEEALVGYDDADYVRIDVNTGVRSVIGKLGAGDLISSGDIVSVKGGSTYLTAKSLKKGAKCNDYDCLVEVDPKTGKMVKNWGSIEHKNVFGMSFWGGKLYGFDKQGTLFEVTFGAMQLSTQGISIPQRPSDLSFYGAGSSTSAPLVVEPQ